MSLPTNHCPCPTVQPEVLANVLVLALVVVVAADLAQKNMTMTMKWTLTTTMMMMRREKIFPSTIAAEAPDEARKNQRRRKRSGGISWSATGKVGYVLLLVTMDHRLTIVCLAALKCRQRKKAWLAQLQAKVEYLTTENERLTSALVASRDEISRLSAMVGGAGVVGLGSSNGSTGQPLSMSVNMGGGKSVTVGGRGGAGYGY